jgi:RIO kinase 1
LIASRPELLTSPPVWFAMPSRTVLEERVSEIHTDDDALTAFIEEHWITDVLHVLKSGKEGTVYCCQAASHTGHEFLAAKVYRSREHRMYHNNVVYQEGRWIGDRRLQRAVANKSRTGREFQSDSWVAHEFETLQLLHSAGASVPQPFARNGQALLMTYIGDPVAPAPLLQHAGLSADAADPLFRRLLREIELWLDCGCVHADLSPFNILYWEGEPVVIDFPQAVDPATNAQARELLTRDLTNLCRFFARFGVRADAEALAGGLWRRMRSRDV